MPTEKGKAIARWKIEKFWGDYKSRAEAIRVKGRPYEIRIFERNLLLNEGINAMWNLICGSASFEAYDNAHAYIGVGNSDTAAAAAQTDLLGASKKYKAMDSGYPTYGTAQKATWRSTFASADANFAWKEITVGNAVAGGENMNRKVESMGTKVVGSTWTVSLEITLS